MDKIDTKTDPEFREVDEAHLSDEGATKRGLHHSIGLVVAAIRGCEAAEAAGVVHVDFNLSSESAVAMIAALIRQAPPIVERDRWDVSEVPPHGVLNDRLPILTAIWEAAREMDWHSAERLDVFIIRQLRERVSREAFDVTERGRLNAIGELRILRNDLGDALRNLGRAERERNQVSARLETTIEANCRLHQELQVALNERDGLRREKTAHEWLNNVKFSRDVADLQAAKSSIEHSRKYWIEEYTRLRAAYGDAFANFRDALNNLRMP